MLLFLCIPGGKKHWTNQKEIREKAFVGDNVMCKVEELSPGGTF